MSTQADRDDWKAFMRAERVKAESESIQDLIERSSLGTPDAKALRATVSDERVAAVMARVKAMSTDRDAACCCECSPPEFGGNLPDRECPLHGELRDELAKVLMDSRHYTQAMQWHDARRNADGVLASEWLAQVRAEARSAALTEAAEAIEGALLHDPDCETCEDTRDAARIIRALLDGTT